MSLVRIKAFPRWLSLTISIPHNGEVTRPLIPSQVFGCTDLQARYLTRECFATYCLADGTPCSETEALLQPDPPAPEQEFTPAFWIEEGGNSPTPEVENPEDRSAEPESSQPESETVDEDDDKGEEDDDDNNDEVTTDRRKKRKPRAERPAS